MEKLSRAKKWQEKRSEISQDQEKQIYTEDLNRYDEKLKSLEGFFREGAGGNGINTFPFQEEPKFETKEEVNDVAASLLNKINESVMHPEVEETPVFVEPVTEVKNETPVEEKPQEDETLSSLLSKIQQALDEPEEEVKPEINNIPEIEEFVFEEVAPITETKVETPVQIVTQSAPDVEANPISAPVEEIKEIQEEVIPEGVEVLPDYSKMEEDQVIDPIETVPLKPMPEVELTPAQENVVVENPIIETLPVFEHVEEEAAIEEPVVNETSVEEVAEASVVEPVKEEVAIEPTIKPETRSITEQIFADVNNYNKEKKQMDVAELSNSIIDEVRHPDGKTSTSKFELEDDDEFSNTVSLEINKVLNEINNENTLSLDPTIVMNNITNNVELEKTAEIAFNDAEVKAAVETIQDKVDENEPISIKNLSEMNFENEGTKPFDIVETNNDLEIEDEADLEDGAGKALNVILGILIFVLIAVLGVIIYYILVYRGIL